MYQELDLKTLKARRWLKKLCFYKIKNNGIPSYLAELIHSESHLYNSQNKSNITTYSCRTDAFKYSFFPWMINEWNKLNFNIPKSSFNIFQAFLIKIRDRNSHWTLDSVQQKMLYVQHSCIKAG